MKYKLTFALVALMTSTAFAEFKAPLPEFKNEKQLAEWRAERASDSTSQGYAAEEAAFFTGRPYVGVPPFLDPTFMRVLVGCWCFVG